MTNVKPLLTVEDLRVHFNVGGGTLKAVDGVDFQLFPGETLALVGESGCGKSTLAKALVGLNPVTQGRALLHGEPLTGISRKALRRYRSQLQLIFQDPYASLNPRFTIAETIGEPLLLHGKATRQDLDAKVCELRLRYPHEFSGGQRQRISIARALAVEPQLLLCDEVTSALDVSIQAQILDLLRSIQQKRGLSYLFITHDLGVVRYIAHRVAVMYVGQIVELRDTESLFESPAHPYTKALLSSIPRVASARSAGKSERKPLSGEVPSPARPPSGCRFHPRCPQAFERCPTEMPPLYDIGPSPHEVGAGAPTDTRLIPHGQSRCFLDE